MRAAVYDGTGGLEVIAVRDVPAPVCGDGEVVVAVAYAGLNRADILERKGRYPAPRSAVTIPGLEYAGVVHAVGAGIERRAGERVCGLVTSGAHAEFVAARADTVATVPDGLSFRDAAALPEAFITAHDALHARARFARGSRVLVHAIGSSVGLAAAGLAKLGGASIVIGTSRTPSKVERARSYGVDAGIVLSDDWVQQVLTATGGRGVDCVLDFAGAPTLSRNVLVLANCGAIVQIGTMGGTKPPDFDLGTLMARRATLVGTVLRTRSLDEKAALARTFERDVLPNVASGALRPAIDRVVPLANLAAAHRAMEANENFGKIVIEIDPTLK